MLNRSYACVALIICTSVAFAQEASTPPTSTGASTGVGGAVPAPAIAPSNAVMPVAPSNVTSTPITTGTNESVDIKPASSAGSEEGEGFSLPGGMGYAPLNFTPGQGRFDRKPLSFGTTLQQGYDDNINSTSGSSLQAPVKGSFFTSLSEGADLLISQSRFGLSMGANAGGQYYWTRDGDKLTPNGGLNLVMGYKLTPRAQLSAMVNGLYTTQPTLSVVNGLNQANAKGSLVASSKFDLLYRWAPRFSTDTFYSINGTHQASADVQSNNSMNQTFGQSLRYSFSPLVTGVVEGRFAKLTYGNGSGTTLSSLQNDANTYFALAGADVTLSRLFSGSFRGGTTTRDYQAVDQSSTTSPYAEGSLNYTLTRTSSVSLDARYGYDDSSSSAVTSKSSRVGVSFTQGFTSKLRGTVGVNYTHIDSAQNAIATESSQDAFDATVGLQYALNQSLTLFGSVNRSQRNSSDPLQEYTKNVYFLGATLNY